MINVTVSMDEDTARWVRVEAAKAGKSVSRWLGEILAERRAGGDRYDQAARGFLERGAYNLGYGGRAPKREDIYDELLHRHHNAGVREGSSEPLEAETGSHVDQGADRGKSRRRKRPSRS
jgi:hypothetical protein